MYHKPFIQSLVINWHITEACNYSCQYCYANWERCERPQQLAKKPEYTSELLNELYKFFHPANRANPLVDKISWKSVRLNLAGGEPTLYQDRLVEIAQEAHKIGFDVSLITNGSQLNQDLVEKLAPEISWLGISLDSTLADTNRIIGRRDRRGNLLNIDKLCSVLDFGRKLNPQLNIKINTVVNRYNHLEDLRPLINSAAPDKWKVLRVLPLINENLIVSDKEYSQFLIRHKELTGIISVENNLDMVDSYIMVNPYGQFFQNSSFSINHGYNYSRSIVQVGAKTAFSDITFTPDRFAARYSPQMTGARI